MKERPIIFSGPMVWALLEGRKTQTRRVIKPQPVNDFWMGAHLGEVFAKCPFGQIRSRLWVRETFGLQLEPCKEYPNGLIVYKADLPPDSTFQYEGGGSAWRPSIFMPRWASRITLEITGVRVERVQDISELDIVAEGIRDTFDGKRFVPADYHYKELWDSLNAKRGYSWDTNPWVWVLEFRVVQPC